MKKHKNGFCLVKEDGPDVIRTRDPRHVKALPRIVTVTFLVIALNPTQHNLKPRSSGTDSETIYKAKITKPPQMIG
jgi:hypothetical protein